MKKSLRVLKIFVLLAVKYCFFLSTNAQIIGTIIDSHSSKTIDQASILITELKKGTVSGADGYFAFDGIHEGTYTLRVNILGYRSQSKKVVITKGSLAEVNFAMQPVHMEIEQVSIQHNRMEKLIDVPSQESSGLETAFTSISNIRIQEIGAKTAMDALNYVPGALVETRGRKVKQFYSSRGQVYPYPEYAINGIWQREFHEMPYFFSASNISSIEVNRSSAAMLTGLSGMAGVVNIQTIDTDSLTNIAELEYGSFETFRGYLSHGNKFDKLSYSIGMGMQHTNGPKNLHALEEMSNFYGMIHFDPLHKLSINTYLFHIIGKRELVLALPPASKRFQTELVTYDPLKSTMGSIEFFYKPNSSRSTTLQLSYSHRNPQLITEIDSTHQISRLNEKDYEYSINLIQAVSLSANNILRIGGLYNHWVAPNGKRFYTGRKSDMETYSFVIVDEQKLGDVYFDLGAKMSQTYMNEYGAFGIEGSASGLGKVKPVVNEWEPAIYQISMGTSYTIRQYISFHGSFAWGAVQPRTGTLDINMEKPANEQRAKADLGFIFNLTGIGKYVATVFYTYQKDALILSGQTYTLDNKIMELYLNRNQNQKGVEFEFTSEKYFNVLSGFYNIALMMSEKYVDGKMKENNELPNWISSGGLSFRNKNFNINVFGKYVSEYESNRFVASKNENPPEFKPLGDYLELNLTSSYALGKRKQSEVYMEMENIFDIRYSTVVGYPHFGRQFVFGFRCHL